MKTLNVSVYYNNAYRKCAWNGYSTYKEQIVMVSGDRQECLNECWKLIQEGKNKPDDFYYLNERYLWNEQHFFLEMLFPNKKGITMDGGNFAYSSDSRFQKITGSWNPIPIHDRVETQEEYDNLSR